jgi:hypothetical protein
VFISTRRQIKTPLQLISRSYELKGVKEGHFANRWSRESDTAAFYAEQSVNYCYEMACFCGVFSYAFSVRGSWHYKLVIFGMP